jgi:hypothetical protein
MEWELANERASDGPMQWLLLIMFAKMRPIATVLQTGRISFPCWPRFAIRTQFQNRSTQNAIADDSPRLKRLAF